MTAFDIDTLDLFAGPGGWSVAAAALGLREVGVEFDQWACATRAAAGHLTVRADVSTLDPRPMRGKIRGLIASPPCGTFSAAGKGEGVDDLPLLHQALDDLASGRDTRTQLAAACSDPRTPLVVEPLRYALAIRPEWIALEQVPAVLPLWRHIARILRTLGYSAWAGILNSADYGVPQTRQRAILIASRVCTAAPPAPTHAKNAEPDTLFGPGRERWVSMAQALGWAPPLAAGVDDTRGERKTPGGNEFSPSGPSWALTEKTRSWVLRIGDQARVTARDLGEPASTLFFGHQKNEVRWVLRNNTQANAASRGLDEPAGTLFFGARGNDVSWVRERPATIVCATDRIARPGHRDREGGEAQFEDSVRISVQEAAILQSFRPDYPWQGTKTKKFEQIGNAWCPRAAAAVIGAAAGMDWVAAVGREYGAPAADVERAA